MFLGPGHDCAPIWAGSLLAGRRAARTSRFAHDLGGSHGSDLVALPVLCALGIPCARAALRLFTTTGRVRHDDAPTGFVTRKL